MELKIDKCWKFLSLDKAGWWLFDKMPFLYHYEWWPEDKGEVCAVKRIFNLSEFNGEPKLFRHKGDDWIEVPKNSMENR